MCLTELTFDRRIAYAFLFEIKSKFRSRLENQQQDLMVQSAFGLNNQLAAMLSSQMVSNEKSIRFLKNSQDYFSNNPAMEKINQVKTQLSNAKKVMNQNVGMSNFFLVIC